MKLPFFYSILILFYSCNAQNKSNPQNMERFNISEFKALQKNGEYTRITKDTTISQYEYADGYAEKTIPSKGWFYEYKDFYPSGQLRASGKQFICGDYKAGIWIECDETGNTKQTNYDKQYRLDLEAVLQILESKKIPFKREDTINTITRNVVENKPTWFVKWQIVYDRVETLKIDDASASVVKQGYIKFQSDH